MLPLGEVCLVGLAEPGLRTLHGRRRGADVDVDGLHLLAVGQQLYALSLQLLDAQALYLLLLAELLHFVGLLSLGLTHMTPVTLSSGPGEVSTQIGRAHV